MSKVQVDTIVDKDDISAPTFSKGAIVTGVCTATTFVGALTGNADTATTATTTSGNAGGLTGSPNITVTDVNATGVTTTGIATVTTSVVVGSAVTANADGVITAGVGTFGSVVSSGAISGTTGTFTGDIDIADKIVHTGDTDTAIRFSAADTVTVETGGTNRITVNNNASVNTLDVAGGARADFFVGRSNQSAPTADASIYRAADNTLALATSSTERLRIGSSGEIGIAGANYGTSGQVLTSAGSGSAPSWTTPAGGGWVPLDSTTTDFNNTYAYESTNIFSNNTSYQQFRIEFYIRMQSLGKVLLYQYDSGAWQADGSNYVWANRVSNGNSNAWTHTTSGGAQGEIPISNNNMHAHQGSVTIWNPNLTTVQATWVSEVKGWYGFQPTYDVENMQMDYCATLAEREIGSGSPVAVGGVRIKPTASIAACYVTVYGLKTA